MVSVLDVNVIGRAMEPAAIHEARFDVGAVDPSAIRLGRRRVDNGGCQDAAHLGQREVNIVIAGDENDCVSVQQDTRQGRNEDRVVRENRLHHQDAIRAIAGKVVKNTRAVDDPRCVKVEDVAVKNQLQGVATFVRRPTADTSPELIEHACQVGIGRIRRLAIAHP